MILEAMIGGASGAILLAPLLRLSRAALAESGYILLAMMLAVYAGARLVGGSLQSVILEALFVCFTLIAARIAMFKWSPSIGLFILLHGSYDTLVGPSTGVADWYPALCAGFDFVVGGSLAFLLLRKSRSSDDPGLN